MLLYWVTCFVNLTNQQKMHIVCVFIWIHMYIYNIHKHTEQGQRLGFLLSALIYLLTVSSFMKKFSLVCWKKIVSRGWELILLPAVDVIEFSVAVCQMKRVVWLQWDNMFHRCISATCLCWMLDRHWLLESLIQAQISCAQSPPKQFKQRWKLWWLSEFMLCLIICT